MNSYVSILTKTISKKDQIKNLIDDDDNDQFYKGMILTVQEFSHIKRLSEMEMEIDEEDESNRIWNYEGPLTLTNSD